MNNKIAILADTHAGARNDSIQFNEYFINFFETIFFPYIQKHNIRNVIHLGDIFDRRKYINFNTLNSWNQRVFSKLNDWCDRVDIIIGNHDTYYKNTNHINSVNELLSKYDKFRSYETAEEVMWGDTSILYVPWICDDNQEHSINLIKTSTAPLCLGHLTIKGFEMHRGQVNFDLGFNASDFQKYCMTLSGHFHHKSKAGNIQYLGSPYEWLWSDYGDTRGFHVLDTSLLELEYIANPEKIFLKMFYDDSAFCDNVVHSFPEVDFTVAQSKFVRVIVKTKNNPYLFDKFLDKVNQQSPYDVSVIEADIVDFSDLMNDEDVLANDTLTVLKEYTNNIESNIEKGVLVSAVESLYNEALNFNDKLISK